VRFGIIGLGRIGGNLAAQAMEKGHEVVGHSKSDKEIKNLSLKGLDPAYSVEEFVQKLDFPRVVFLYIPHGKPVDDVCAEMKTHLQKGDILIDGGNSWSHGRRIKRAKLWIICGVDR
jgi:6-phosphogluconate dehydrogenase